ncbi:MAG: hypothetical protein ACQ9MH_27375 [Nitrospinales bacterium]
MRLHKITINKQADNIGCPEHPPDAPEFYSGVRDCEMGDLCILGDILNQHNIRGAKIVARIKLQKRTCGKQSLFILPFLNE